MQKRSRLAYGGFFAALGLTFFTLIMGPLHRFGVIEFAFARQVLTFAAFAGPVIAALCLTAAFLARQSRTIALAGLILSLLVAGLIWSIVRTAMFLPRIHDITTDINDPPAFEAVLALRSTGNNDAAYAGEEIAQQQLAAYPDIVPLEIRLSPDLAFDRALKTAEVLRWHIAAADRTKGHIEAVDTTLWFGFKDDIVIRVRPTETGTVIDLRSASRIGLSDIGANALRIRRFLTIFKELE